MTWIENCVGAEIDRIDFALRPLMCSSGSHLDHTTALVDQTVDAGEGARKSKTCSTVDTQAPRNGGRSVLGSVVGAGAGLDFLELQRWMPFAKRRQLIWAQDRKKPSLG